MWFSRGFTNQRETYYFCANCLSTLECYSPADSADDAEECSKLHYFAEKDMLFEVKAVLLFWGFICVNLRDLREALGFHLC